ncbi:hypothetical protein [Botryobacter ruber]|uniref:hypothetical protein n=1 Tax=Botryobacter ruber TaxID=2171629 RepID=UPI000F64AC5F|nr:hypothetical protein [Botryobacter ruber]
MKKSLKLAALAFLFTLPALSVSAQSATPGDPTPRPATAVAAVPADNLLALLSEEEASAVSTSNTAAAAAAVTDKEPATAKSMSEELSAWVENKLAVVNSVKGLKRLK